MNQRLQTLYSEILQKCNAANCSEFEYYWEILGVLWYPWTLEINGKLESFSFNDVSLNDLEALCDLNYIKLVKEYSKDEMDSEFDRKRYRIVKQENFNI